MNCPKCNKEFSIKLGTKIDAKGCEVLTNITTILTVRCLSCSSTFQLPISSKSFLSTSEENKKN